MLGIDDPYVLSAYILCVASAVFCIVYGFANWNRGDEEVQAQDVRWASEERKCEEGP
jgi:hypothetical protein